MVGDDVFDERSQPVTVYNIVTYLCCGMMSRLMDYCTPLLICLLLLMGSVCCGWRFGSRSELTVQAGAG